VDVRVDCGEREADDSVIWGENIDSDCRLRPKELVTPAENPHNTFSSDYSAARRSPVRQCFSHGGTEGTGLTLGVSDTDWRVSESIRL
jgi:hypothetical protein